MACRWPLREHPFIERRTGDFVGEIGAALQTFHCALHFVEIVFDGIKVEWALMWVHAFIVGDRALVASME